jgi:hypothetical protein
VEATLENRAELPAETGHEKTEDSTGYEGLAVTGAAKSGAISIDSIFANPDHATIAATRQGNEF